MRNCFLLFLLSGLFCGLLLSSCKFNPNYQGSGSDFMQGVWDEVPPVYKDSLIQYTQHNFRFTCDSVYITLETDAKENYYADSCFNNGNWKEYAKGNYVLSNDTLYIISTFTHANFKQKLSDCYRIGRYVPAFVVKSKSEDQIVLQGVQEHGAITLQLKERTVCVPKPL